MTLIDELRAKKEKLTESLNACTDEKAYDLIDADLREITKALTLAENQEKKRLADEAAAKRKAELDSYNAELRRLQKAKKDTDALDADLFEKIHVVYDAFSKQYDAKTKIMQDTKLLQRRAEELQLEVPSIIPLEICNFSDSQGDKRDFFTGLIGQYTNAVRSLHGAHKRKEKGAPARPGMDWYTKGFGQFYPRDPEPEPPTREKQFKISMADKLKAASQNAKQAG